MKDALAIDPEHVEAQKLMQNLEDRSFELKKQATTLTLLSRHRDALQKISIAIETNPAVAEFHNIRYVWNKITFTWAKLCFKIKPHQHILVHLCIFIQGSSASKT